MSELKTNKISPATGTDVTLGDSGDTFTIPSGATIVNSGTATNFGDSLPAVGSSGNVMTSDGANWASTAPAGGGAWTLIETISTASTGDFNVDYYNQPTYFTFTGLDTTVYESYVFTVTNARGWNAGQKLGFEWGIPGYGNSLHWEHFFANASTGVASGSYIYNQRYNDRTYISLMGVAATGTYNSGWSSNQLTGTYYISPGRLRNNAQTTGNDTPPFPALYGIGTVTQESAESGGAQCHNIHVSGMLKNNSVVPSGFRLGWTADRWSDGSVSLYGIARS